MSIGAFFYGRLDRFGNLVLCYWTLGVAPNLILFLSLSYVEHLVTKKSGFLLTFERILPIFERYLPTQSGVPKYWRRSPKIS